MSAPLLMADWSDPANTVIEGGGLAAFAFYVGGNTPHAWTPAQIGRQILRWACPTWVYGLRPGSAGGHADARECVTALAALGVPAGKGIAIRIDMETAVDGPYLLAFREVVDPDGWWEGTYGSASTVFGNPAMGGGYWVADWRGSPFEYPHNNVWATQYADAQQNGTPWDCSEILPVAVDHLWDRFPRPGEYVSDGSMSLAAFAARRGTAPEHVIHQTATLLRPRAFGPLEAAYVGAGDWGALMPAGMVVWSP